MLQRAVHFAQPLHDSMAAAGLSAAYVGLPSLQSCVTQCDYCNPTKLRGPRWGVSRTAAASSLVAVSGMSPNCFDQMYAMHLDCELFSLALAYMQHMTV